MHQDLPTPATEADRLASQRAAIELTPRPSRLIDEPLNAGIFREVVPGADSFVAWLADQSGGRVWERLTVLPAAPQQVEPAVYQYSAVLDRIEQRLSGRVRGLLRRLMPDDSGQTWTLPSGEVGDRVGDRIVDVVVIHSASVDLDEWVRVRRIESTKVRRLGPNLLLVREALKAESNEGVSTQDLIERILAAARRDGDRHREARALADLGALLVRECKNDAAISYLEEARTLALDLGERELAIDVMCNLGMAFIYTGSIDRALEMLGQALNAAAGEPVATKFALARIGLAHAASRDYSRAISHFERAAELARQVGDKDHEAELLWHQAIQYADLGKPDEVSRTAGEAVRLWEAMGKPQAAWFAGHLRQYQAVLGGSRGSFSGSVTATMGILLPDPGQATPLENPGFLRMAFSATTAMVAFLGSGLKMAPAATREARLSTCGGCEYHTGFRCRVCGCFTDAKARMMSEICPLGKW